MKAKRMIRDYSYCNGNDCKKRDKCKRWIGNYENCILDPYTSYLIDRDCINRDFIMFDNVSNKFKRREE
jgi:hypothetical protein